jgi:hypothetical protein
MPSSWESFASQRNAAAAPRSRHIGHSPTDELAAPLQVPWPWQQTRFLINIRKCDHHFSYTTIRLSQAGFAGMTTERDLCWEKREWPTAVHHSSKIFLKRYTYHTHTICLQFATFHSSNKKAFLFGQNGKILGPQKNGCTV